MRRLFLILLMLTAAPDASAAPKAAYECLGGLAEIFDKIQSDSIDPVSAHTLITATLSGLTAAQPAVTVSEQDGRVAASRRGQPAGSWPLPPDGDDKAAMARWMEPLAAVIDVALPEIGENGDAWAHTCHSMLESALRAAHPRNAYLGGNGASCPGGTGLEFEASPEGPRITQVISATPAERADIRTGDVLRRIDGTETAPLTPSEIREKLCGAIGEAVSLDLSRNGETLSKSVERTKLNLPTVSDTMRGTVLVIAIRALYQGTSREVQAALERGRAAGMTAVLLDLRNHPGGLLDQVITVSDLFVDKGPLLTIRSRRSEDTHRHNARPGAVELPLAVLVDGRTFLAGEAIAAILQQRVGALVIGTATPGRGEISTLLPVSFFGKGSIRLVTAHMETPSGQPIEGRGVLPDICTAGGTARRLKPATRETCPPETRTGDSDLETALAELRSVMGPTLPQHTIEHSR